VQNGVLSQIDDPDLRAYVIWVPMFFGAERDVPRATREVSDARSLHYWDGESASMRAVRATLKLSEDAWDIFLLYPPGVRWEGDNPPTPEFWMHQLGSDSNPRLNGPYLDPETFLTRTRAVLATTQ
jgi:hypothetical protein